MVAPSAVTGGGGGAANHAPSPLDDGLRQRLLQFLITRCDPPQAVMEADTSAAGGDRNLLTLNIDVMQLLDTCWELTDPLLSNNTLGTLDMLKAEVQNLFQTARCDGPGASSVARSLQPQTAPQAAPIAPNSEVALRLTHVPPLTQLTAGGTAISLKESVGCLRVLTGTIIRMAGKRVVPARSAFRCGKCGTNSSIPSDPFHRGDAPKPRCDQKSCKGEVLQVIAQTWMDYTECRLQQRIEATGKMPRSVLVALDDELTTKCTVGQLVEVVGVVRERWKNVQNGANASIELVVWALNITSIDASRQANATSSSNNHGMDAMARFRPDAFMAQYCVDGQSMHIHREKLRVALLLSSCPQLSGVFGPRLGVLLTAVDGAARRRSGGTVGAAPHHQTRSTIHMLLVGDPSTGKSQLLRFAAAIAPRSTCTTGVTTTSAGLTVAASKEFGEWVLEPGALVLSDGGTCCIDELRTVSAADRTSLHEAMEQQTISVAKAGLVTRLRTVCSVISACNPPMKRKNPYGHVNVEIGVGGPLLSRFDLIFLMWDYAGSNMDLEIAAHILECSAEPPLPPLSASQLAQFLAQTRAKYAANGGPLLEDGAAALLGRYYEMLRSRGPTPNLCDAVPVTVRLLEALIRIAQAHAKLLQGDVCTEEDAAMAIFLMERTAHGSRFPLNVPSDVAEAALVAIGETRSTGSSKEGDDCKQLYTSTRWLDEVFLSATPAAIDLQRAVMRSVVERFGRDMDHLDGTGSSSSPGDPAPSLGEDAVQLLTSVSVAQTASRKRSRDAGDLDLSQAQHSTSSVRRSSVSSAGSVSSPHLSERSVACYDPSAFATPVATAHRHASEHHGIVHDKQDDAPEVLEFGDADDDHALLSGPSQPVPSQPVGLSQPSTASTGDVPRSQLTAVHPPRRSVDDILKQLSFTAFGKR